MKRRWRIPLDDPYFIPGVVNPHRKHPYRGEIGISILR